MAGTKNTDNNFTPLRLLLALLVVLGHFKAFVGIWSPTWPFNYAATAVDCFFVVSGYLVANSFDRDPNLFRFYTRRFFRIYPLYFVVIVAAALVLGAIAPGGWAGNARSIGSYLFFNAIFANFAQHDIGSGVLKGLVDPSLNASLWTLKIEFAFYLIVPFLWRWQARAGSWPLIAIFALSAIYYQALLAAGHYDIAKQLPGQMQYFVLGIAAYRYRDRIPAFGPVTGLALTGVLATLVTLLQVSHVPVLFPLVVAAFVIVATFRAPRLRMESDISYGVYLLHAPVIQLMLLFGLYRPDWLGLAAILAIVLPLAISAEHLIEKPGIAFGRRVARGARKSGPGAAVTASEPSGMTVVVLNDYCYVQGGASKVAIDEAVGLARAGAEVIFVGAVGPVSDQLKLPGLRVECLGQRELNDVGRHPGVMLQGLWNFAAARRMRQVLGSLKPDRTVVHLHGYTKALTTSPVRIARSLGFPVVCTLHDFFAACPNGAFYDYAAGKTCDRRPLSLGCAARHCDKRRYVHKLFRLVRGVIQRRVGRFPAAVLDYIPLSRKSAGLLAPYLPRDARLHPLANVIDAVRSPPVDTGSNGAIVCVGRLDQEKGVLMLARLASELGLSVTFVGDGPLRAEVEALAGVTVTGWVPAVAVTRYLDRARYLVFPSLWYETYGLVVGEAAARGVPAIVSDISAAAERIEDGVTGWVFRSGDTADLMRCLKLAGDDAAVRAAGLAAYRAYWADAETPARHAGHLIDIYRLAMQA
jgi:peptidoglycan/LPS O-acetylase OafA/YrhL/glycosyltransferase involved in cell wall biosynthesis